MFKRILLTLDGSKMAEQALQTAINHAKIFQSELILFRVINLLTKSYRAGLGCISAIERAEENLRLMANEYFRRDCRKSSRRWFGSESCHADWRVI